MRYPGLPGLPGPTARLACLTLLALAPLTLASCQPKQKLPPKVVPKVDVLLDSEGQRVNVVADAVQVGSNLARLVYDCRTPHGINIEGGGVLAPTLTRCEFNQESQQLTIAGDGGGDCAAFLMTVTAYRGPGTYNTSALGALSFGTAKVKQRACNFEANICMDWNGAQSAHADTTCTVEIGSDGGLQYGAMGATVSGTFVCSAFRNDWKGCPGASATTGCAITRGSFSIAGCNVQAAPQRPRKGKRGG